MLLTAGYGSNSYVFSVVPNEWTAYLLVGDVGARNVGSVLSAYWRQDTAAPVNFAEVGFAYGAPVPGDDVNLKLIGANDATEAFTRVAAPDTNVTRDVALAYSVPPGASLWLLTHVSTNSDELPRLVGANSMDPLAAGLVLTRAALGNALVDSIGQIVTFTKQRTRRPIQAAVTP